MSDVCLQFLESSPFRSAMPQIPKEADQLEEFLEEFKDEDRTQVEITENPIDEAYEAGFYKNCLQSVPTLSASLQGELFDSETSPGLSHAKVKILSEYMLSKINKDEKLLSLAELMRLVAKIEDMKLTQAELHAQLNKNHEIVETTLVNSSVSTETKEILVTLNKMNAELITHIKQVDHDLLSNMELLQQQFLLAFQLNYFEDIKVELPSLQHGSSDVNDAGSYDMLMSHIVSTATQRGITLPVPTELNDSFKKVEWAKDCIDTMFKSDNPLLNSEQRKSIRLIADSQQNEVNALKTALKDLQFAHKYLTGQYEEERNSSSIAMNNFNIKKNALEKQLAESSVNLEKVTQRSLLIEHEKNVLESKIDEKNNEIFALQKQIAMLKIENIGHVANNENRDSSVFSDTLSPVSKDVNDYSPVSPTNSSDTERRHTLNPKTPLLQQNISTLSVFNSSSPSSPRFRSSISVLRKEFKTMVSDIQNDFQNELEKERAERKRLEKLVQIYETRESDVAI